jgi:gliding motility-associated-like protein
MRKDLLFNLKAIQAIAKLLFFVSIFCIQSRNAFATHAAGADLTYRFISHSNSLGDTYEVTGTFYRDCSGVAAPNSLDITISSASCNYNNSTISLPKIAGTGQEITFPCSTSTTKCTNPNSSIMGYQKYVYRGNVTFPSHCTDWLISYSVLARNCAITTMQQGSPCGQTTPIYVEATLNNFNSVHNNSPTFSNNPVAFICQNQNFVFNHGVTDIDGDSLVFELIDAMRAHNQSIPYVPPFSGTNPLTSIPAVSINAVNGDITMNPQNLEIGVIAIRIKEYRNGVMVGSIIRDMQFIVTNCYPNVLPTATGVNGTNVYSATVCPGNTLSFFINSDDTNVANIVTMTASGLPTGATFSSAGTPHPTGTFTWTPTSAQARPQPYIFTVRVQDNNCPANAFQTYAYTIYVPDILATLTASNHNGYNVSCHGGSDGTITAAPSGGTSPYTYSWSPAGGNAATTTGLPAGSYTVTVTDFNGCPKNFSYTLTEPPDLISILETQTNVLCNGATTGAASFTVTGGVPGYTYLWSPGGQVNDTAVNLGAGNYIAVVTDLNGCHDTVPVNITEPPLLQPVIDSAVDISCNGNSNGAIYVSVSGGAPGYTYSWSPGGYNTEDITGLDTGTYVLTVTDSNGCIKTVSATIIQPAAVSPLPGLPVSSTNLFCNNDSSGTASVDVILLGGTPPYNYSWSTGDTTSSVSNLHAGSITITILDANGCTADTTFIISEPAPLITSIINPSPYNCGFDVSCNGMSDANLDLTVTGGTVPYTYDWNSGADTSQDLSNIPAGPYNLTVTDSNGCVANDLYNVTEPAPIAVNISSPVNAGGYNIACHGESSGRIHTAVTGGCGPYIFDFHTGGGPQPEDSIIGLPAGFYTVTVLDQNGCSIDDTITLTEPDTIVPLITSVIINGVNVTCFGFNDGEVFLDTIIGGSPPYSWTWSPSGTSADTLGGVGAGQYSVYVVDVNGCSNDAFITLNQPDPIASQLSTSHYNAFEISCHGASDGYINIDTVFGGVPSYTYSWSTASTADSIGGLTAGVYSLMITDTNGCIDSVDIPLTEPDAYLVSATISETNGYSVPCNGNFDGTIDLSLFGGTGNYFYLWTPNGETTPNLTALNAGTYCVHITDDNNCPFDTCFTLTQPPVLGATDSLSVYNGGTNISCYSQYTGYAGVNITGGVPNYTVVWSTGDTAFFLANLPAGTFSYTVTDSSGCTFTDSVTLTQPLPVDVLQDSATSILCNGDTSGCIYLSVTGGIGPFTFYWPNEDSTEDVCNLGAGIFPVITTDANGCVSVDTFSLTEPTALASSFSTSIYGSYNIQCATGNNGFIDVNVSGGTPNYTYTWTGTASTSDTANGLSAGNYSVIIADANQCSDTINVTLTEPTPIIITPSFTNTNCNSDSTGTAEVSVSGGVIPYSYSWSPNGETTDSIGGLPAGSYTCTVTDSNSCTATSTVSIIQPATLTVSVSGSSSVTCNGGADGVAIANVSGGSAAYSYLWAPNGSINDTITNLTSGTYTVTVTDINSCTGTDSFTITDPPALTTSASAPADICGSSVSLSGTLSGNQTGAWSSSDPGVTFDDTTSINAQASNLTYAATTGFTWTVTENITQCIATATLQVHADEPVTADADAEDTVFCLNAPEYDGHFHLTAMQSNAGIGTWTVASGSGTIDDSSALSIHYNTMTPEQSVLVWSVVNGVCAADDSVSVNLRNDGACLELELPTGYTPNSDGFNDDYDIHGIENYPHNTFIVFNRWGNEVYKKEDYVNHQWKGDNNNGNALPDGTYYVMLLINDGSKMTRNTYVDLRR